MGTYKCCIFFTRRFALGDTTTPEDVRALFSRFAAGLPYMGPDDLRRYLAAWGGADGEIAERVVDRVLLDRSRTPRFGRPALTVDDFMHFLFSEELNPPLRHSKGIRELLLMESWITKACCWDFAVELRRLATAEHLVDPTTAAFLGYIAGETDASLARGEAPPRQRARLRSPR